MSSDSASDGSAASDGDEERPVEYYNREIADWMNPGDANSNGARAATKQSAVTLVAVSPGDDGMPGDRAAAGGRRDRLVDCTQSRGLFYGYVVLLTATVGKIFTSPGQSPCIGVAITPIRESLGETRSKVTLLYLVATTCSALTLPWTTGRAIDRWGPRKCVFVIALGLAAACFVVSTAHSWPHLLLAFYMLRFFGQGSLMNVSITEINYWWVKRRGVMMGFAGACVSLGMLALVPAFMDYHIAEVGWRKTYVIMGTMCALFMAPFGLVWYRDRPEAYGLRPDGEPPRAAGSEDDDDASDDAVDDGSALRTTENWTAGEALRTCTFWAFAAAQLSMSLTGTAFWFHLKEVLADAGLSDSVQKAMYPPVEILQNTFSDRTRCIAQLRPGSSFPLSAPRFLDRPRRARSCSRGAARTPRARGLRAGGSARG